jgi:hypothetical protein
MDGIIFPCNIHIDGILMNANIYEFFIDLEIPISGVEVGVANPKQVNPTKKRVSRAHTTFGKIACSYSINFQ